MAIAEATSPIALTWTTSTNTIKTSASFTPAAGTLLVAMVNCGSSPAVATPVTTMSVTDSLSGVWTLLKRQNTIVTNLVAGTAEVWCRYLFTAPGAMTVSTIAATGTSSGGVLAIRVLTGAAAQQDGATAGVTRSNTTTAVSSPITSAVGGWVYGSAFNFNTSAALTVLANTTAVTSNVDATQNCNWSAFKSTTATAGSATYGYSTAVPAQLAEVEIMPSYLRSRRLGKILS